MKRWLFLAAGAILAASTYAYAVSPGHYGAVIAVGAVASFFFVNKGVN
ncbi:hypothetical protein [Nocardia sp. NPDC005825]